MQERRPAQALTTIASRSAAPVLALITVAVAAAVVVLDQATKSWALGRLSHGDVHVVWKLDFALTFNSGSAFGLARGWAPVLSGVALVVVMSILATMRHVRSRPIAVALGLILGGALGNLADRLLRGHHGAVVDFIALHFWPTFNVADSCIVIGSVLSVILMWRTERTRTAG